MRRTSKRKAKNTKAKMSDLVAFGVGVSAGLVSYSVIALLGVIRKAMGSLV